MLTQRDRPNKPEQAITVKRWVSLIGPPRPPRGLGFSWLMWIGLFGFVGRTTEMRPSEKARHLLSGRGRSPPCERFPLPMAIREAGHHLQRATRCCLSNTVFHPPLIILRPYRRRSGCRRYSSGGAMRPLFARRRGHPPKEGPPLGGPYLKETRCQAFLPQDISALPTRPSRHREGLLLKP